MTRSRISVPLAKPTSWAGFAISSTRQTMSAPTLGCRLVSSIVTWAEAFREARSSAAVARRRVFLLKNVVFPELVRRLDAPRSMFGRAQLHAADLSGDRFRQLAELDAADALVGRQ